MKVYVAGYQAISILHGGPNTQLRNTVKFLPHHGVEAHLFDPWARFKKMECDLFHIYAANIGTYHLAREIHALGIPLVVSPIIYSLHSPRFVRTTLGLTRMLQKLGRGIWSDYALCADICSWARKVLPNTRAEADLIHRALKVPSANIAVIPNGVDERFLHADPNHFRRQYRVQDFILTVTHVGHERKNVLRLIQALGQIDHPAVIVGRIIKNEYGDACVREAAKFKHIRLIDRLEHGSDMLASAYAACDVFVLPSLFETPGIAALEAALAGARVVITRHGGPEEYFGSMVTYVDPESVTSIRDGITRALGQPKSGELQEHVRNNFLWQHIAQKTAEVYKQVLGTVERRRDVRRYPRPRHRRPRGPQRHAQSGGTQ